MGGRPPKGVSRFIGDSLNRREKNITLFMIKKIAQNVSNMCDPVKEIVLVNLKGPSLENSTPLNTFSVPNTHLDHFWKSYIVSLKLQSENTTRLV